MYTGVSNNMTHNKQPHDRLIPLIAAGKISILKMPEEDIREKFFDYISNEYPLVPVMGDSIDWSKVPNSTSIHLETASDLEVGRFVNTLTISNYSKLALIYSTNRPCYIIDWDTFVNNMDWILSIIPHTSYFLG